MPKGTEIVIRETELVKNFDQFSEDDIRHRIYTIRGVQVMLDRDLADLYGVETGQLNRQVKRNMDRFPSDFMFQLTRDEAEFTRCQNGTLKEGKGSNIKYLPYAFTEEGVSTLASVLKSHRAAQAHVRIMRAFVAMRRYLVSNAGLLQRLERVETKQLETDAWKIEINNRFDQVLDQMEDGTLKHKLGIFFDNQMFDAYVMVEELVKRCKKRLVLIDDYVDGDVLERFRVREAGAPVDVYVQNIHKTRAMETAFETYHRQYPSEHVELHVFNKSHDRWLIIDDEVYHFGASIKDLGKKWFQVNQIIEYTADELIARLDD